MNETLIEFIKIGFHGAAISMAVLTYRLLSKALSMWGPQVKPGAAKILDRLLIEIRVFMGVCIILFLVGVIAQMLSPQKESVANVMIYPPTWPKTISHLEQHISLHHEERAIELIKGLAKISVHDKDNIRFIINDLVYEVEAMDKNYKTLLADRSPNKGFGN